MEYYDLIRKYAQQPISRQVLLPLLKEYKRPNDKVNELVKQGVLSTLKRGLYIAGPLLGVAKPEPYLIANHLSGPSYVSFDTALSYWQLIPERVYEVTSATVGLSKKFRTTVGRFVYIHIDLPYYSFGIKQVKLSATQTVLMASPEKALCDKIITTKNLQLRSSKQVRQFILEDLRMKKEALLKLNITDIVKWLPKAPKRQSLQLLANTLKDL